MTEDSSQPQDQTPAGMRDKTSGYVKNKIKRQNSPSRRSRARACEAKILKQAAELLDLIEENDASSAVKALRAGLNATKLMWDGNARDWVEQPDWKERREAALAILAYKFGKPIERQVQVHADFEDLPALLARISASPRAMKKLGHLVPRHELDSS